MEDDDDFGPTFNGKPLTARLAYAEILRLRDTIKNLSETISAEKSSVQASVDATLSTLVSEQSDRVLEILHIGDWVGFDKSFESVLEGTDLAKLIATLKANTTNNEMVMFSGNFLGACMSATSSHFSPMMNVLSVAGMYIPVADRSYGVSR